MFGAFTSFGKLGALASSVARAWSPLALWPDGVNSPGMWIDPSLLTASFNDSAGTTPVATPGSVADSANPVGLALDIRAGAPDTLGPELVTNGDFSDGTTGWTGRNGATGAIVDGGMEVTSPVNFFGGVVQSLTLVVGHFYLLTATVRVGTAPQVEIRVDYGGNVSTSSSTNTAIQVIFAAPSATNLIQLNTFAGGGTAFFDNISVKEIPGNHMLQATSAARPLMSARVNLLTYTEDLSNAYWAKFATTTYGTNYIQETAAAQAYGFGLPGGLGRYIDEITLGAKVKAGLRSKIYFGVVGTGNTPGSQFIVDIAAKSATITNQGGSVGAFSYVEEGGWLRVKCSTTGMAGGYPSMQIIVVSDGNLNYPFSYAGTNGEIALYITDLSLTATSQADLPYQSVPGNGSAYSATGITPFQLYDGVDDGMATASFAAGTLTSSMDCMIAVRRDSGANCVAGLYNGIADATKFFGMAESASGSDCVGSGAGTPTVWVDNTQLTGGTAVTRGTLHTALTVGDWHILEFRGLDLSTWTAAGFGLYTSYVFPGARGDILLYPSTASTEDKDAARQYLADYYGVTLP